MPSSPDGSVRNWVAVGPASLLDMLVPLRDEHCRLGSAELVPVEPEHIERFLNDFRAERTALLVVEDPEAPSVRDHFRSPLLHGDHAAADVVVGWLRLDEQELADYAHRAVALLDRQRSDETTLVLLSPRERRYLELLDELETSARSLDLTPLRWSAERIRQAPLTRALRLGAAAVLYSGHGNPAGWFAYGGLTAQTIIGCDPWTAEHTNAVLFSLSCSTGRERTRHWETAGHGRAFADDIVAGGVAGAVLAPLGNPLHAHSRIVARAVVHAIAADTASLCAILERTQRNGASLDGYAVIGDPELPVRASVGAAARGAAVFAPAPDAALDENPVWGRAGFQ